MMQNLHINKPFALIIFGASGNLAKLKLFPAIYELFSHKRLPKDFHIIGYGRTPKTNKQFHSEFTQSLKESQGKELNQKSLKELLTHVHYISGSYDEKEDFINLKEELNTITGDHSITKLAYFSVPPQAFKPIIKNLGQTKNSKTEDIRLILEKPFGEDTASARSLFHFVSRYFREREIFLLDHYLGKLAVQSLLNLRHSNRLLNLMMKGSEVANIQITASETVGVNERAGYFDQVGTIKDMIQSHLLQILALITMSIPITNDAISLHREKYAILSALKFEPKSKNLVIGQYKTYTKEKDVPKTSKTETFAAIRLLIDRESWFNVPIYLRTGKKLDKKTTYVTIEMKKFAFQSKEEEPNTLMIELQPNERINIKLINKFGIASENQSITTSDSIACQGDNCLSEHSLLLLDVMENRRLNFLSFPEVLATWHLTDQIIKFIKSKKLTPEIYTDKSTGPNSQQDLTKQDGFKWHENK